MKKNHIPVEVRLQQRIDRMNDRLDQCFIREKDRYYQFCSDCGRTNIEVNMKGHRKECVFQGLEAQIRYYEKLKGKMIMEESTLIIWEEIPENTRFFLIPNVTIKKKLENAIVSANGYFVNCKGDENVFDLQKFLFDEEGTCIRPKFEVKSENGKLVFDNVMITKVCHTGFAL